MGPKEPLATKPRIFNIQTEIMIHFLLFLIYTPAQFFHISQYIKYFIGYLYLFIHITFFMLYFYLKKLQLFNSIQIWINGGVLDEACTSKRSCPAGNLRRGNSGRKAEMYPGRRASSRAGWAAGKPDSWGTERPPGPSPPSSAGWVMGGGPWCPNGGLSLWEMDPLTLERKPCRDGRTTRGIAI